MPGAIGLLVHYDLCFPFQASVCLAGRDDSLVR